MPERADASAKWEETSGISSQDFVRTLNLFIDARVASHPEVREWGQLSVDGLTVGLGVEDDADARRTEKLRTDLATELAGTSLAVAITKPGDGVGTPVFVVPSDNHPAIGTWTSDEFPYFRLELEKAGQGGGDEDCNSIGFHWSAPTEDSIEVQAIISTAVGCEERESRVAPEFGTGTVNGDVLTLRDEAGAVTAEMVRAQR